jgi:DUF4097 and DUF4098 domain-containing protein YvlB
MRKSHVLTSALGISVLALGSAACSIDVRGEGIVTREEKRFTVKGQVDLNLRTFDGSVQLKSWDRNEVLVEIERRAQDTVSAEALIVNATQEGGRIVIEAPAPRDRERIHFGSWQGPSVSFVVTAPRKLNAEVRTGDGSINAEDFAGAVALNSGDGSIRARRIDGTLRARTGDGSIAVTDGAGRVEADSGDGSVELAGRFEALDVRTGDGSVRLDVFDGSELKTDWSITTGDGSITLRLPRNLDAELDAHTGDGRIHADGVAARVEKSDDDNDDQGSLRTAIGKGGRSLRLRSGDGSIKISR